ncbi:MAG: hypothetical protein HRT79_10135 [Halomonas sp.]|nr:hypothetical protein [Halomonas sp.]
MELRPSSKSGESGKRGESGKSGNSVESGKRGESVESGQKGNRGESVESGQKGKRGKSGRMGKSVGLASPQRWPDSKSRMPEVRRWMTGVPQGGQHDCLACWCWRQRWLHWPPGATCWRWGARRTTCWRRGGWR